MQSNLDDEQVDYYSLLGVGRDATKKEIQRAFVTLAATFHPDKFLDEKKKEEAQKRFIDITKARDILMDDEKRRAYDLYGYFCDENGELGAALKDPEELMKEILRNRRRQHIDYLSHRVDSSGSIVLHSNFKRRRINYMNIVESLWFPIGNTKACLKAGVLSSQDTGSISLGCKLSHLVSELMVLNAKGKIQGSYLSGSLGWAYSIPSIMTNLKCDLKINNSLSPTLKIGAIASLPHEIQLSTSFEIGRPKINTKVFYQGLNGHQQLSLDATDSILEVSALSKYSLSERTAVIFEAVMGSEISFAGQFFHEYYWKFSTYWERTISQLTRIRAAFFLSPSSVGIVFGFTRLGQTFGFPIILAEKLTWVNGTLCTIFPVMFAYVIHTLFFEPAIRKKRLEKDARKNEAMKKKIKLAMQKSETDRSFIIEEVQRKRDFEKQKNGLVIIHAFYGKIPESTKNENNNDNEINYQEDIDCDPSRVDVTDFLQYLVQNEQLQIPAEAEKSSLLGFYDPCPGEKKFIEVLYLFRNVLHSVLIEENKALRLPLSSHKVKMD